MQTEETRALIKTYYATLPTGNRDKLASLFTEDVEWYPPESAPLAVVKGREAGNPWQEAERLIAAIAEPRAARALA